MSWRLFSLWSQLFRQLQQIIFPLESAGERLPPLPPPIPPPPSGGGRRRGDGDMAR